MVNLTFLITWNNKKQIRIFLLTFSLQCTFCKLSNRFAERFAETLKPRSYIKLWVKCKIQQVSKNCGLTLKNFRQILGSNFLSP